MSMDLCKDCHRLNTATGRPDEVRHLTRTATLRHHARTTFRYHCEACGAEWDWTHGHGWQMRDQTRTAPLLSRLFSAARSRFTPP
jgi:hypothetical protein